MVIDVRIRRGAPGAGGPHAQEVALPAPPLSPGQGRAAASPLGAEHPRERR